MIILILMERIINIFPDFLIDGQIIEIKGTQYLDDNGKLKDKDKQKCIEENNVIIWSYNEIKPYIQYCEEKYNDKYWYKAFKYHSNYIPSHCQHTDLIKTPKQCLICGSIFQNGQFLSAHLKFEEHISGKDYYDKYLKKENERICIVCGKPTKYIILQEVIKFVVQENVLLLQKEKIN